MDISKLTIKFTPKLHFTRYVFVGAMAFVADYGVLNLTYYILNLNLILATTLGFLTGFIISFSSNRRWVFKESGSQRKVYRQVIEYTMLVIFNYLFTVLSIKWLKTLGLEPPIAKLIIMSVITIWNYVIFKKVIFRPKASE